MHVAWHMVDQKLASSPWTSAHRKNSFFFFQIWTHDTSMPCGSRQINVLEEIGAVARTTLKSKRRAEDWTSWRSPKPSCTTRRGSTGKGAPTGTSPSETAGQPIAREANVMRERPVITGTPEVFMSSEKGLQEWLPVFLLATSRLEKEGWEAAVKACRCHDRQHGGAEPKRKRSAIFQTPWAKCDLYFAWTSECCEVQKIPMLKCSAFLQRMSEKLPRSRIGVTRRALLIIPPIFRQTSKLACGVHSVLLPGQGAPPDGNGPPAHR